MPTKSEETGLRILTAALELFRRDGFEQATMRAIVRDFYRRSCVGMQPQIEEALDGVSGLEKRLLALIRVKLTHFGPNRGVLRALLHGADPKHPLSPFSAETREIREIDMAWFGRILVDCGVRVPRDLTPHLPGILWFFQMGVILFWVIDESPGQKRTERLLELAAKSVVALVRLSGLPLMRPVRRTALELVEVVTGHGYAA
jgi:hypothetical protein